MIRSLDEVLESRLTWPENKPRAARRITASFKTEVGRAASEIEAALTRSGIRSFIISRNHQRIFSGDPGAAVWWTDKKRELRVLACDQYLLLAHNLHAIALTLDAMRALARWGAYTMEQAVEGARAALPPPKPEGGTDWWVTIGVNRDWPLEAIEAIYRTKAEKAHPDRGGSLERMQELNAAIAAARKEVAR